MHHGSCLCGAVRYELDGAIPLVVYCHCSQCRRSTGSAFNATTVVESKALRFTEGRDALTAYESIPGKRRHFCSRCGSTMLTTLAEDREHVRLRLGTVNDPPTQLPGFHIFVGSKAPWYEIRDDLKQFPGSPSDSFR
jgi:hypothetical protein